MRNRLWRWQLGLSEWFVGSLVAGAVMLVYLLTMAPEITWGWSHVGDDAGDLITSAWVLGVPHPPGYPTYMLLAWLFTRLPLGSVAWRVHLLSGVAGMGAAVLLYWVGRNALGADRPRFPARLGAMAGAFIFAFAPLFWSHALIAEVYTLHLFFVALVLALMQRWRLCGRGLPLAALVFGLGMGNHLTLTLMGPLILVLLWAGRKKLSVRQVLASALALVLGLAVYAYLPWRAVADPVINWGDPETYQQFSWVVAAKAYRQYLFALPVASLPERLLDWARLMNTQFSPVTWLLALLGLWRLARRDHWLLLGSLTHAALNLAYSLGYNVSDAYVHLLPVIFHVALWMGLGACQLLLILRGLAGLGRLRYPALALASLVLLGLAWASPLVDWHNVDISGDREAQSFGESALTLVEPDALILARADAYIFTLWYYHYVEGMRPDVIIVNPALYTFQWYRETVASHYPELRAKGSEYITPTAMVLYNLDERPVYVTEESIKLIGLHLTPVETLWQVSTP